MHGDDNDDHGLQQWLQQMEELSRCAQVTLEVAVVDEVKRTGALAIFVNELHSLLPTLTIRCVGVQQPPPDTDASLAQSVARVDADIDPLATFRQMAEFVARSLPEKLLYVQCELQLSPLLYTVVLYTQK